MSNNYNNDGGCGRMLLLFGGLTAQVNWHGLRVGSHPALSLHSSNEPGELPHYKHCRGYYYYYYRGIIYYQKTFI